MCSCIRQIVTCFLAFPSVISSVLIRCTRLSSRLRCIINVAYAVQIHGPSSACVFFYVVIVLKTFKRNGHHFSISSKILSQSKLTISSKPFFRRTEGFFLAQISLHCSSSSFSKIPSQVCFNSLIDIIHCPMYVGYPTLSARCTS